jgi:hypothetical protein
MGNEGRVPNYNLLSLQGSSEDQTIRTAGKLRVDACYKLCFMVDK